MELATPIKCENPKLEDGIWSITENFLATTSTHETTSLELTTQMIQNLCHEKYGDWSVEEPKSLMMPLEANRQIFWDSESLPLNVENCLNLSYQKCVHKMKSDDDCYDWTNKTVSDHKQTVIKKNYSALTRKLLLANCEVNKNRPKTLGPSRFGL